MRIKKEIIICDSILCTIRHMVSGLIDPKKQYYHVLIEHIVRRKVDYTNICYKIGKIIVSGQKDKNVEGMAIKRELMKMELIRDVEMVKKICPKTPIEISNFLNVNDRMAKQISN